MKKLTKKKILAAILMCLSAASCCTASASAPVASLPTPPVHPALDQPELMSEKDRARLADFYRSYEVYLKKLAAWKKAFGG